MMARMKPYLTAFKLRALQETQYRGAALGGLVTQAFFGLVYISLYSALIGDSDPVLLRETITYVWLQQMFFRILYVSSDEVNQLIFSGGMAYAVVRPVDQQLFWLFRDYASRLVAGTMRSLPMILVQLILPAHLRMSLADSPAAFAMFALSLFTGILCACVITSICQAINMKTLDNKGISAMLSLIMMTFSGNVVPLTLFPERLQTLIRFQPFAQALDLPIRCWQSTMSLGEWGLFFGVQLGWLAALMGLARFLWARRLKDLTIQGG